MKELRYNEKLMKKRYHRRMKVQKPKSKSTTKRKWILSITISMVTLLIAFGVAVWRVSASLPFSAFEQTRLALDLARQAEADVYASELLRDAERAWEQARLAWQSENEKWYILRNFQFAQSLAESATRQAHDAANLAIKTRDSMRVATKADIVSMRKKINEFKAQFAGIPVAKSVKHKFVRGELLLMESEQAFARRDYPRAAEKIKTAIYLISNADANATQSLQAYLANVPKWRHWVAETIAWSAQRKAVAIIVDKMAFKCQVYVAGRLKAEYPIEMGPHWMRHKRQRGDGATPEGRYHVTHKKGAGESKYYKALEINYPNQEDLREFEAAKNRGDLSRATQIGGLIEIHGDGGKGANWTKGCVALRNSDMDKIFELASVGTPVTIAGALRDLPAVSQTSLDFLEQGSKVASIATSNRSTIEKNYEQRYRGN